MCRRLDKGFAHFEEWRDGILEDEEVLRHKMDRKIVRETRWLNRGVTARRKRNMGRLRALIQLRKDWRNLRRAAGMVEMTALESRRSGKRVIEAKGIVKAYDGNTVLKDFSTRILRGDRIGIVGPNGTGKTTLLNMLTGNGEPDAGTVDVGSNIDLVTLDQKRESLEGATRLADALTGKSGDSVTVGGQQKHVMSYMQDFLFAPEQARTQISALSGGERGRLMLARAFARPSNVLVLDEPTNDLNLETLDLLQELLADYNGTVILASHDRDFLDRVVTSVIASEGERSVGRVRRRLYGYADAAWRHTRARDGGGAKPRAAAPRIKRCRKPKRSFPTRTSICWKPCRERWRCCSVQSTAIRQPWPRPTCSRVILLGLKQRLMAWHRRRQICRWRRIAGWSSRYCAMKWKGIDCVRPVRIMAVWGKGGRLWQKTGNRNLMN